MKNSTIDLQARRRLLIDKQFTVEFSGGWYVRDGKTGNTKPATTFKLAIEGAEAANS